MGEINHQVTFLYLLLTVPLFRVSNDPTNQTTGSICKQVGSKNAILPKEMPLCIAFLLNLL